jgi:hypothetical protein
MRLLILVVLTALAGCATPPEPPPAPPEPVAPVAARLPPVYRLGVIWQAGSAAGAARQGAGYIHVLQPEPAGLEPLAR